MSVIKQLGAGAMIRVLHLMLIASHLDQEVPCKNSVSVIKKGQIFMAVITKGHGQIY